MYPILEKRLLAEGIWLMKVLAPRVARSAQPGQFVIVRVDEHGERIPLTISDFDAAEGSVTIVTQAIGASTRKICALNEGDALADFAGPLGHPSEFVKMPVEELRPRRYLFVAGGVGTAPVYPQVKWLREHGVKADVIIGAKTRDMLIYTDAMRAVAENLAARRTSVCRMAQAAHCDVLPVDLGIAGAPVPGVRDCRIAAGTADFTKGPAMTRAEAVEAIGRGISLTRQLAAEGYGLVATGEMGIGNTTTSSAIAAVLLAQPVQTMTGRGAGLSDAGLARKVDTIRRGIACNAPDPDDVLDVLGKLGGFDIAGLCGMFLGGALAGVPVLMDGFISGVAALCAVRLCPAAAKAVFASHCSTEPAARLVLDALGKTPLLTAGLHLGEGTGAVASIPLWDMALAVYDGCYSFAEGGIAPYMPQC